MLTSEYDVRIEYLIILSLFPSLFSPTVAACSNTAREAGNCLSSLNREGSAYSLCPLPIRAQPAKDRGWRGERIVGALHSQRTDDHCPQAVLEIREEQMTS